MNTHDTKKKIRYMENPIKKMKNEKKKKKIKNLENEIHDKKSSCQWKSNVK